jgi:hypothetical protein
VAGKLVFASFLALACNRGVFKEVCIEIPLGTGRVAEDTIINCTPVDTIFVKLVVSGLRKNTGQ